jgi:hypothetical protein
MHTDMFYIVLPFRYSILDEDNPPWQNIPEFDKLPKHLFHHHLQRFDTFDTRLLYLSVSAMYLVAFSL